MRWWQLNKRHSDLERELQSDLELEEEQQRERGLPPEHAHYAARRAFGNVTFIREQTREAWGWAPLELIWQDVRYALRQLRRSPGFAITSVVILALGIGAVTAVFSLIDAALLKMLPVQSPEQLVDFKNVNPELQENEFFSYPTFRSFQNQTQVLAGALAFRKVRDINLEVDGSGGLVNGHLVSGNYFSVLGVRAIQGRTILPGDESIAAPSPVAVIGYDYWRRRFGLDPGIIGKSVRLNDAPFTIIGVTSPEFSGVQPGEKVDVFIPLTTIASVYPGYAASGSQADALKAPFRNWLRVMGRLQPGVSRDKATASLEPVFAQAMREAADSLAGMPIDSPAVRQAFLDFRLQLEPGSQGLASLRRQFSKPLWIVMALVALLLLITCANVANLLLARAGAREKEIAVRFALGAARGRLIRQLLTESIVLGLTGGAIGVALAYLGSRSLLALMARGRSPASLSVHPDATVLAFALGISLLTALIFGTIPAFRAAEVNPSHGLAQSTRTYSGGGLHHGMGKSLVVLQVAISLVLVIGAGLLARTLANLRNFYPGFNRESVLMFSVDPTIVGYKDVVPVYDRLLNNLRRIPGVRSASLSVHQPLSPDVSTTIVKVQGPTGKEGEDLASVGIEPVGPDFFATMEIPLSRGRDFSWTDRDGTPKVAIVNESMARHYFGGADPIGQFVSIPGFVGDASWIQIVGEIRDIKVHDLREPETFMLYLPLFQLPEGGATFEMRTVMDPTFAETAAFGAVKAIDSRLPVFSTKTLAGQIDDSLVQERLVASLSEVFGLVALVLTCVGLYGLMAYSVNRRTCEIGVRMALGAERAGIARMILREALLLFACGLAIGLPAAALASRFIASQLFGVTPADPITFSAACVLMAAVAITASYLPARRAASIDPMQALRTE
ncbi:MAG TPA: ABC transporter permease [Blastocatellia bacterium]